MGRMGRGESHRRGILVRLIIWYFSSFSSCLLSNKLHIFWCISIWKQVVVSWKRWSPQDVHHRLQQQVHDDGIWIFSQNTSQEVLFNIWKERKRWCWRRWRNQTRKRENNFICTWKWYFGLLEYSSILMALNPIKNQQEERHAGTLFHQDAHLHDHLS